MAQFRSTADIANEVLQKSGEVTNGNSPYESLVMTYLNKAHQAIVGGGSILSLEVDEVWPWARSRTPIVLDLEPAFVTGSIAVTNADINVTFSDAPATSKQGWHLQLGTERTVYRITQHTAGDVAAVIDSAMIEDTGTYTFRAFKLDYEILPQYLYVDNRNDKLDFIESGSTQLTATLTHGSYTPANYITHVVARLNATGTNGVYSGSYDSVLKLFTLTSSGSGGKILSLLGATGTNRQRSALPLLGLDQKDHTGALTYTSAYVINGISRLIEPFKAYIGLSEDTQIMSTDSDHMEQEFPLSFAAERTPTKFCFLTEDNAGVKWVRFNSYPHTRMKVTIDWVPMPHDLQDNAASVPLIPRRDIDCLINGAAAMVLYDKEDSKFDSMLALAEKQLRAMQKKNRSELFRTSDNFAQVVPRQDYLPEKRRLRYGYTVSQGVSDPGTSTAQTMVSATLTYADFQTAALTNTVTARTLPANRTLFSLIVKHSTAFSGGSISALTLDVGISGDPTKFINGFDIFQAVGAAAQDSALVIYYPGVATAIQVRVTAVGANLSALTAGSVTLYFQESIVP